MDGHSKVRYTREEFVYDEFAPWTVWHAQAVVSKGEVKLATIKLDARKGGFGAKGEQKNNANSRSQRGT